MAKGDIVLIAFPFTDLTGKKLIPAVVLIENSLDLTVCFITTQTGCKESTDIIISPSQENGIRKQSLIRTSKIATLDRTLAKGLLGKLTIVQTVELNKNLIELFQIAEK